MASNYGYDPAQFGQMRANIVGQQGQAMQGAIAQGTAAVQQGLSGGAKMQKEWNRAKSMYETTVKALDSLESILQTVPDKDDALKQISQQLGVAEGFSSKIPQPPKLGDDVTPYMAGLNKALSHIGMTIAKETGMTTSEVMMLMDKPELIGSELSKRQQRQATQQFATDIAGGKQANVVGPWAPPITEPVPTVTPEGQPSVNDAPMAKTVTTPYTEKEAVLKGYEGSVDPDVVKTISGAISREDTAKRAEEAAAAKAETSAQEKERQAERQAALDESLIEQRKAATRGTQARTARTVASKKDQTPAQLLAEEYVKKFAPEIGLAMAYAEANPSTSYESSVVKARSIFNKVISKVSSVNKKRIKKGKEQSALDGIYSVIDNIGLSQDVSEAIKAAVSVDNGRIKFEPKVVDFEKSVSRITSGGGADWKSDQAFVNALKEKGWTDQQINDPTVGEQLANTYSQWMTAQ